MHTTDHLNIALDGKYRIERELGRGGMATVYLADDIKHDRRVAVKVLHRELAASIGAERFDTEIKTTASLQHPHILPLFDSGSASTHPDRREGSSFLYYVMPYIEGETVREKLNRETQFSVDDAVRIAREVADALDYAHRHGVVHRDVKPENILLHDGRAMVMDFGIALALRAATGKRITETGLSLGTPHYMSPEQAAAEKDITPRSDVYSLGAVLYEMLTGSPPHTAPTAQQVVMKIIGEEAKPAVTLRRSVPVHVSAAIAKSLEKSAADRYENAKAFSDALGEMPGATVATSAGFRTPAGNRRMLIALSIVAAASLATAGWALLRPREAIDMPVIRTSLDVSAGTRSPFLSSSTIALSPRGDRLAFFVQDSISTRIIVRRSDEVSGHEVPLTVTTTNLNAAFSPDGEWIAYTDGFDIKKVRADGGPSVTIGTATNLIMRGLTWTVADSILIGSPSGIWMVPASGGTTKRAIVSDSLARHHWPVASADGKLVAFITGKTPDLTYVAVVSLRDRSTAVLEARAIAVLGFQHEHLIYITPQGGVMALPFDARRLRATGDPVQVDEGVRVGDVSFGAAATLSASGTLAYFAGSSTNLLVAASPGRGDARVIADAGYYKNPRYSPDGKRIALAIGNANTGDIWVYDVGLRTLRQLTAEGSNGAPEWSPDGKRILFRSQRGGVVAIWWQPADGSAKSELLYQPDDQVNEAILSPDGNWIVYRTGPATRHPSDILGVRLNGDRRPVTLVEGPGAEVTPRFSPDGKWLAYASNRSGRLEIYVQPFPGLGAAVQVSTQGGREPVWAASGRALYYRTLSGSVVAVATSTGTAFSLGDRRTVVPGEYLIDQTHTGYDVSPDGSVFLMVKSAGGAARPTIVYNWGREMKGKLAAGKK